MREYGRQGARICEGPRVGVGLEGMCAREGMKNFRKKVMKSHRSVRHFGFWGKRTRVQLWGSLVIECAWGEAASRTRTRDVPPGQTKKRNEALRRDQHGPCFGRRERRGEERREEKGANACETSVGRAGSEDKE